MRTTVERTSRQSLTALAKEPVVSVRRVLPTIGLALAFTGTAIWPDVAPPWQGPAPAAPVARDDLALRADEQARHVSIATPRDVTLYARPAIPLPAAKFEQVDEVLAALDVEAVRKEATQEEGRVLRAGRGGRAVPRSPRSGRGRRYPTQRPA